ncbi:MAG: hypothetical protein FWH21_00905 [Kiritimatiellaeota bacterium]|nr:hypothetical protein [Kiritimatiellota bacterium]
MTFFKAPELSGLPPRDERPKVTLEGDALASAMRSVWDTRAAASPHIEPVKDPKITTHQRSNCEKMQSAAVRLGMNALSQWEVYISERERNLERTFDSEIMATKFSAWLADRVVNMSRYGVPDAPTVNGEQT